MWWRLMCRCCICFGYVVQWSFMLPRHTHWDVVHSMYTSAQLPDWVLLKHACVTGRGAPCCPTLATKHRVSALRSPPHQTKPYLAPAAAACQRAQNGGATLRQALRGGLAVSCRLPVRSAPIPVATRLPACALHQNPHMAIDPLLG